MKRALIACEYSGTVRDAFIMQGWDAISCDLLETEKPGPHYKGDIREMLVNPRGYDLIIAFPPCTHLAVSGSMHFKKKRADGRQQSGIDFFNLFTALDCKKVCIENPIGIMSKIYRKPDQIIHPFYFGDEAQKSTCLWLKGLNKLMHFKADDLFDIKTHAGKGEFVEFINKKTGKIRRQPKWYYDAAKEYLSGGSKDAVGHNRSRTFPGFAQAMAIQWS